MNLWAYGYSDSVTLSAQDAFTALLLLDMLVCICVAGRYLLKDVGFISFLMNCFRFYGLTNKRVLKIQQLPILG